MSKIKNSTIDLDALRNEFPGVSDDRLSVVADFRSVKRPATAVKVADAVMHATGALEFECSATGELRVWVNNTISGGTEGEAAWSGGKWSAGTVNGKNVKGAAEFVRIIGETSPESREIVPGPAPLRAVQLTDTPLAALVIPQGEDSTPAPVKGETDRVRIALENARAKVAAKGPDPVDDSEDAFNDAADRIAAGLAILTGPDSDALPVAGPVPVVEVPEVIRTMRDVTPPADMVIPFVKRVMHVVRHHGNVIDTPGSLRTPDRRKAVASAITVDLQDLCGMVRDIDGNGTHLVDLSPEAVRLMDYARETLAHLRSLALSGGTRGLMGRSKRKNVKVRMSEKFAAIMAPDFRDVLNKRMAGRA